MTEYATNEYLPLHGYVQTAKSMSKKVRMTIPNCVQEVL